jgi:hypothetical protein
VRDTRYQWAARHCPRTNGGPWLAFGAACPARGVAAGLVMPFADTEAMNAHLAEIARTVAPGAHAILVLDGAGALVVPDNISLVTLPPYAPELNPIENVWAYLRGNKLAITVFDSYDAIVAKCCDAWNFFANNPSAIVSITSRDWSEVSN